MSRPLSDMSIVELMEEMHSLSQFNELPTGPEFPSREKIVADQSRRKSIKAELAKRESEFEINAWKFGRIVHSNGTVEHIPIRIGRNETNEDLARRLSQSGFVEVSNTAWPDDPKFGTGSDAIEFQCRQRIDEILQGREISVNRHIQGLLVKKVVAGLNDVEIDELDLYNKFSEWVSAMNTYKDELSACDNLSDRLHGNGWPQLPETVRSFLLKF